MNAKPPIRRRFVRAAAAASTFAAAFAAAGGSAMAGQGTIRTMTSWVGPEIPKGTPINFDADPHCRKVNAGKTILTEEAVVDPDTRRVANVFVYVKSGLPEGPYPAPETPVRLDQRDCRYIPHVVGVQVDQPFEIVSSDPTLHNINVPAKENRPFNLPMPEPTTRVRKFRKAESPIRVKCDAHPWMEAWLHVVDHPFFAVSDVSGEAKICGLPPGKYVVAAWHEKFGEKERLVEVGEDGETLAEFEFGAPPPPVP